MRSLPGFESWLELDTALSKRNVELMLQLVKKQRDGLQAELQSLEG